MIQNLTQAYAGSETAGQHTQEQEAGTIPFYEAQIKQKLLTGRLNHANISEIKSLLLILEQRFNYLLSREKLRELLMEAETEPRAESQDAGKESIQAGHTGSQEPTPILWNNEQEARYFQIEMRISRFIQRGNIKLVEAQRHTQELEADRRTGEIYLANKTQIFHLLKIEPTKELGEISK